MTIILLNGRDVSAVFILYNGRTNVTVQAIKIYTDNSLKSWRDQNCSPERCYKLVMSKNRMDVLRVDRVVNSSSFFLVEIFSAYNNVQFESQASQVETDNKAKLREEFQLFCLVMEEDIGG